jgi:phosphate transport system permease protein
MSQTDDKTPTDLELAGFKDPLPLSHGVLPRSALPVVAMFAVGVTGFVKLFGGSGWPLAVFIGWLVILLGFSGWSLALENRRAATDKFVGILMWTAFVLAMIPLVSLIYTVVKKGGPVLTPEFLSSDMTGRALLGEGGGIYHAIMGTFMVTAIATVIAVPIGILTAVWLVEYGQGSKLAAAITFLVDVMTGIPSIVAGLFAFALFAVITNDPLPRLGLGGGVALALLMVPTVVRSVEEMLKLVPDDLREAAYALGVPKWRTIVKVVLPTSVAGIVTGVTLAIARVAGETAPLLLILGTAREANWNPFDGGVQTLPVFIFQSLNQTAGPDGDVWTDRVWGAALFLIIIVMLLNIVARLVGSIFAPKTGK